MEGGKGIEELLASPLRCSTDQVLQVLEVETIPAEPLGNKCKA